MYASHSKTVAVLIEAGADVNARDNDCWTALMHAARWGRFEAVKVLIEAGADVNARDNDGRTPLMHASDSEIVKVLIEAGADVNARDNNGRTPLMRVSDSEAVKVLIEAGADVNAQDSYGETPLMCASDWGRSEAVKALIEAGADVNAQDSYGRTALMYASDWGRSEAVKVLIEAGADVNARSNDGKTPLMRASDSEIVKVLIGAGADVNARDNEGETPLMCASYWGRSEAVKVLIEAGADVNNCFFDLTDSDAIENLLEIGDGYEDSDETVISEKEPETDTVEDDEDENAENEDNGIDMKQAMKAEAVERMKLLGLPEKIINEFQEKSVIYVSESVKYGEIRKVYRLDKNDILCIDIKEFEKEYRGSLVYHVIRDFNGENSYGDIDSFLNVFPEPSEWDYVKKVFKTKKILMDVYAFNRTIPEFSDYGEILVEAKDGGLLRMS